MCLFLLIYIFSYILYMLEVQDFNPNKNLQFLEKSILSCNRLYVHF